jgi:hypothetical protein
MPGHENKAKEEVERTVAGDYLQLAHGDYRHALERLEQLGDGLQEDFKMLGVGLPLFSGAIAGLSGVRKFGGVEVEPANSLWLTFWAFAALTTVVSAIGFRDYVRAVAFEHALYTLVRYERHFTRMVRSLVPKTAGEPVTPAQYFIDKFQPTLMKLVAVSSLVFSIPTTIAPPVILWILGDHRKAAIILAYSGTLAIAYVLVGQLVLSRFTQFFRTVSAGELAKDDPDPPPPAGEGTPS